MQCVSAAQAAAVENPRVVDGSLSPIPASAAALDGKNQMVHVIASWERTGSQLTPRKWHRVACDFPVVITPFDERTNTLCGESRTARIRDISPAGISIRHALPLPFRTMTATFSLGEDRAQSMVLRLKWCRFTRSGQYCSGGMFVRKIALAYQEQLDPQALEPA